MLKSQFNFLCNTFADSKLSATDKWKCIKYIFIENPIADVQRLLKKREIMYIDNSSIGPGFFILGHANTDFSIPKYDEKVVTFIPLRIIDKISLLASLEINDNPNDDPDDPNKIQIKTEGDTLIINNLEVETYEDVIIIKNVAAETEEDALVIKV